MFSGGVDDEPLLLLLFDVGAEKEEKEAKFGSIVVNFQVGISIERNFYPLAEVVDSSRDAYQSCWRHAVDECVMRKRLHGSDSENMMVDRPDVNTSSNERQINAAMQS